MIDVYHCLQIMKKNTFVCLFYFTLLSLISQLILKLHDRKYPSIFNRILSSTGVKPNGRLCVLPVVCGFVCPQLILHPVGLIFFITR